MAVQAEVQTSGIPHTLLVARPFLFVGLSSGGVMQFSLDGAGQDLLTGHQGAINTLALFGTNLITGSVDARVAQWKFDEATR